MNYNQLKKLYGSPFYAYDLSVLRKSCQRLRENLPEHAELFYSLKANPHPSLVNQLLGCGCKAEISSLGELESAIAAGVKITDMLYTGPGKSIKELKYAIDKGVVLFSVESLTELDKITCIAEETKKQISVLVRINPDESFAGSGLAMTGVASQFGMDESKLANRKLLPASPNVKVIGFHIFNGTNIRDVEMLIRSFSHSIKVSLMLAEIWNIKLEMLDLGGGFGHPYAKIGEPCELGELKQKLERILDDEIPNWRSGSPRIVFESGRFLTAACGTLVCSVESVKESKGQVFVVLNSGINHLGGMTGIGRIPKIDFDIIPINGNIGNVYSTATVVGPLCTPLDYFKKNKILSAFQEDDLVAIPNVGAYGLSASLIGFLSREAPLEIVYDDDSIIDVSRLSITRTEVISTERIR